MDCHCRELDGEIGNLVASAHRCGLEATSAIERRPSAALALTLDNGGRMSRRFAKYALVVLVLAALFDASAHRKRKSTHVRSQRDALMTWADEGGAVPN